MIRKFLVLFLFLSLVVVVSGCQKQAGPSTTASSTSLVLFYSTTCPHCQKVEKYLTDNKVRDKINFDMKEISDPVVAQDLINKVKICKLDATNVGVPFLWNNGQCLVGDEDIINFFQNQMNSVK